MAGIIYTANARAPLITDSPAHVADTEYSFDVKLQAFPESIDAPKTVHTAIAGNVETVLKRATRVMSIVLIWPNTINADMDEFLFSIAGGETFSFDAYGTIAVPDNAIDVVCTNNAFGIGRISHGSTPWRSVSMTLRPAV